MLDKLLRYYKQRKLLDEIPDTLINIPKIEIDGLEVCYKRFSAQALSLSESSTLDIGCGNIPRNPFSADKTFGIDIRENKEKGIKFADLSVQSIPYEDAKFDFITAYDFLEHIPKVLYAPSLRFPFVELMNEVYRTLKIGGIFFSHTPIHPFSLSYSDPTHVNVLTDQTFPLYFDDKIIGAKIYGFNGAFSVKYQARKGIHLVSVLQKTLPP
jgi:SAM-dependent methyltransferase